MLSSDEVRQAPQITQWLGQHGRATFSISCFAEFFACAACMQWTAVKVRALSTPGEKCPLSPAGCGPRHSLRAVCTEGAAVRTKSGPSTALASSTVKLGTWADSLLRPSVQQHNAVRHLLDGAAIEWHWLRATTANEAVLASGQDALLPLHAQCKRECRHGSFDKLSNGRGAGARTGAQVGNVRHARLTPAL